MNSNDGEDFKPSVSESVRPKRHLVIFVSGKIIDFDTYLPVAMELKAHIPQLEISFVTFAPSLQRMVNCNPTLRRGLESIGCLRVLGGFKQLPWHIRWWQRFTNFYMLCSLILMRAKPIMFLSRPFSELPYSAAYFAARFRKGLAIVISKTRSPDRVHDIVWQNREKPGRRRKSLAAWVFGRDADITVDYHSDQSENFDIALGFGTTEGARHVRIGMPHLLPAWREHIRKETSIAMVELGDLGIEPTDEIYSMFPAKAFSAVNLRQSDSIQFSFNRGLDTLLAKRPDAQVLLRPHPLALEEDYVRRALERYIGRVHICNFHPEILLALSRRAIFNNPTNITFSCFPGKLIDISDYADQHYADRGNVALSHGLGPLHIGPRRPDFEPLFSEALTNDVVFEEADLIRDRVELLQESPPDITPLVTATGL